MLVSLVSMLVLGHPITPPSPPATYKYRLDIRSQVTIGVKGDTNYLDDLTEATAFVSLTMSDTTIGRFAFFVLDSMRFNGGETAMKVAMETPTLLKNPKGATVRFLIVDGNFDPSLVPPVVTPDDDNIPLSTLLPALPALFPGLRKDAKVGTAWADTSKSRQPGIPDMITSWTVAAGEGDALLFTGTRSGTQRNEAPDSTVMNGKETARHELTTTPLGPARRINIETTMEGIITGGDAGTKGVPIKTVRTLKISPVT